MFKKLQNSSKFKNNIAISVSNVSKTFYLKDDAKFTLRSLFASLFRQGKTKKFEALSHINFEIEKGDFVGIIGRNGSGKSTLLKLIAKIYSPDNKGKIYVNGKLVPFLELGVGFNADLTGKENIYLNGTILGMTRGFINSKFDEIVAFAGLEEFIDTPVKNYSSGMLVRLAFSIALQSNADIYILDEILAVGDAEFQAKSLGVINSLIKAKKTILFVSHDISAIEKLCNKVILINEHKSTLFENTKEGIDRYKQILYGNNKIESRVVSDLNGKRVGSHELYFTKYGFKGKNKNNPIMFNDSDLIEIEVEYVNTINVDKAIFGVAIFNDQGVLISGTNTKVSNIDFRLNSNQGVFTYKLKANLLLDGKYNLTLGLFDYETEKPYDYFVDALSFEIRLGIKNVGFVSLPVEIQHG